MKSRYDIMKISKEKTITGLYYPDVLSFNLNSFIYNYVTKEIVITQTYKDRFYLACFLTYNVCVYDDIVLWLNKKDTVHNLEVGETLFFPDIRDIESFLIANKRKHNE